MRIPFAMAVGILTLAGCNKSRETGQAGGATDTTVTTRETQDTTLIRHDTSVSVDTSVKHGNKATRVDTSQKSGPGTRDTAR